MQLILESVNTSYISAPANFFRIIITFFLIPSLGLAGTIDENFTDDFCVAPKANEIHENSISTNKNPLHKNSLEAILNRGTLRVLIEKITLAKSGKSIYSIIYFNPIYNHIFEEFNLFLIKDIRSVLNSRIHIYSNIS